MRWEEEWWCGGELADDDDYVVSVWESVRGLSVLSRCGGCGHSARLVVVENAPGETPFFMNYAITSKKPTYSYQTGSAFPRSDLEQSEYSKLEEARRDSIHAK